MSRKITMRALVLRADPQYQKEDQYPVEYRMSNGRVFRGYYRNRGAYADDEE